MTWAPISYNLLKYGKMVAPGPRMAAYSAALKGCINPGDRVFDLGASFGAFAVLAAKYGAGEVVAIEPDRSIQLVQKIAEANGLERQVKTFRGLSEDFFPEERADLIVADMRGTIPFFQSNLVTMIDARRRLLKPGGKIIPMKDRVWAALVEDFEFNAEITEVWLSSPFADFSAGHRVAVNTIMQTKLGVDAVISNAESFCEIDYSKVESPDATATMTFAIKRRAQMSGVMLWFDCETAPGISFSNAPDKELLVYNRLMLPFERPVMVDINDKVIVDLSAKLVELDYHFAWVTSIAQEGNCPQNLFRQSTFYSMLPDRGDLSTMRADTVAKDSVVARACSYALNLIDNDRTIGDVARDAAARFASNQLEEGIIEEKVVDALLIINR